MYKVLLVDDDDITLFELRKFRDWASFGFTIEDEAYDGSGALNKLSSKMFDLIITDIRMPGMDGLEFLREVKEKNLDSCFVIMSTYNEFEYAQQGIRLGAFDYIVKPVDENVLGKTLGRIKECLDKKKQQRVKIAENNFRFCYPQRQETRLAELLMAGNNEIKEEASLTCLEVEKLTNQDMYKTSFLLKKMIINLCEDIYKAFPWINTFEEQLIFDDVFDHVTSINDLRSNFMKCINNLLEIIIKYELQHSDSLVKKTCIYVMNHLEEDITIDNVANEVYISKNYIGKLFKQKTGFSFTDYVTKVKMEYAKRLLVTGVYKNYEISNKLGYCSPDYFSRLFKSYTGYTPIEYKKMKCVLIQN